MFKQERKSSLIENFDDPTRLQYLPDSFMISRTLFRHVKDPFTTAPTEPYTLGPIRGVYIQMPSNQLELMFLHSNRGFATSGKLFTGSGPIRGVHIPCSREDASWREPRFPADEFPGPIFLFVKSYIINISAFHGRTEILHLSLESS